MTARITAPAIAFILFGCSPKEKPETEIYDSIVRQTHLAYLAGRNDGMILLKGIKDGTYETAENAKDAAAQMELRFLNTIK